MGSLGPEAILAVVALVVSFTALIVAGFQTLAQLHSSELVIRKTGRAAFGPGYCSTRRKWHWKSLRIKTYYTVPHIESLYFKEASPWPTVAIGSGRLELQPRGAGAFKQALPQRTREDNRHLLQQIAEVERYKQLDGRSWSYRQFVQWRDIKRKKLKDYKHSGASWPSFLVECGGTCLPKLGSVEYDDLNRGATRFEEFDGDFLSQDLKVGLAHTTLRTLLIGGLASGMRGLEYNVSTGIIRMAQMGSITTVIHPVEGAICYYVSPSESDRNMLWSFEAQPSRHHMAMNAIERGMSSLEPQTPVRGWCSEALFRTSSNEWRPYEWFQEVPFLDILGTPELRSSALAQITHESLEERQKNVFVPGHFFHSGSLYPSSPDMYTPLLWQPLLPPGRNAIGNLEALVRKLPEIHSLYDICTSLLPIDVFSVPGLTQYRAECPPAVIPTWSVYSWAMSVGIDFSPHSAPFSSLLVAGGDNPFLGSILAKRAAAIEALDWPVAHQQVNLLSSSSNANIPFVPARAQWDDNLNLMTSDILRWANAEDSCFVTNTASIGLYRMAEDGRRPSAQHSVARLNGKGVPATSGLFHPRVASLSPVPRLAYRHPAFAPTVTNELDVYLSSHALRSYTTWILSFLSNPRKKKVRRQVINVPAHIISDDAVLYVSWLRESNLVVDACGYQLKSMVKAILMYPVTFNVMDEHIAAVYAVMSGVGGEGIAERRRGDIGAVLLWAKLEEWARHMMALENGKLRGQMVLRGVWKQVAQICRERCEKLCLPESAASRWSENLGLTKGQAQYQDGGKSLIAELIVTCWMSIMMYRVVRVLVLAMLHLEEGIDLSFMADGSKGRDAPVKFG